MKIVVINYSGNVGKTTIARHLLGPRLRTTPIMVESVNADGQKSAKTIKGSQYGELQEALLLSTSAVVDVGASNVEEFLELMRQYHGSHEEIDFFVVPTVPETKQLRDTIATIHALSELGVPARKIRVVFNRMRRGENPRQVFEGIYNYHEAEQKFTLVPNAIMLTNEVYQRLSGIHFGLDDLLRDPIDYKAQIQTTDESAKKRQYVQMIGIKQLALGVSGELDELFNILFV